MARRKLSGSITIRVSKPALRAIRKRSRVAGRSPSDLLREVIEREFVAREGMTMYDVSARSVGSVKSKRIPSGSDLRKELKTLATNLRRCESVQRALRDGIHAVEEKMTEVAYRQMPDTKPDYFDAALWEPKGWQPRALSKRSRRKPRSRLKK